MTVPFNPHIGAPFQVIVDVPNLNIAIIWIPVFEWYVDLRSISKKNGHQKDICLEEIGLHAQNMLSILGSIVNTIEGGHI